jgi:hypothetical protein
MEYQLEHGDYNTNKLGTMEDTTSNQIETKCLIVKQGPSETPYHNRYNAYNWVTHIASVGGYW